MERVRDYDALIRELLAGVAGGWSYGNIIVLLMTKGVDEEDLSLWLRKFSEGLSLDRDRELIEQLKLLGKMTPGRLASEAFSIAARLDSSYGQGSEFLNYRSWFDRGLELYKSGVYEESICCFDRAIEINSDYYQAWDHRGIALANLERYEDAIASFDRAIEIEPGYYPAWYFQGITLRDLERYEEAIFSYERAIEIDPVNYQVWLDRGIVFCDYLKKYEKALESFDRSLNLQPNIALHNRGVALSYLGRGEEALASYNLAIEFEPNNHYAFNSRSTEFLRLKRYEEALVDCERAIEIYPEFYRVWVNRGFAIGRLYGYQSEINAYYQAFEHIHSDTNYEGWGFLQCQIGRTHYQEGKDQLFSYHKNPHPYYYQALTSYHKVLDILTHDRFPKLRIETLIDIAKVYLAQRNTPAARECQIEALDILRDLLNAQPTFAGKKRLQIEFASLSQLNVDLFIASGDNINALVAAELDKNNRL
jgi:tetratricopeptide (TPR) repeat protein